MNLYAAGALGLALAGRQGVGSDPAIQERHVQETILERRMALQELLLELTPQARAHALEPLVALKARGVPTLHSPPIEALAEAWHLARGDFDEIEDAPDRTNVLQRIVDSLALRVVPSAFEVDESLAADRGEAMTVFVTPLAALELSCEGECEISLHWVAPDGEARAGGEVLARRESLDPAVLKTREFEMYVHAPGGLAGQWSLVPELESGDERARGIPVPVEGIVDLDSQLEALEGEARARIGTRLATGWREPQGRSLSEFFAGVSSGVQPFSVPGLELSPGRLLAVEPGSPSGGSVDTLVLLAAPGEPAAWSLAGASGRAWSSFADSTGMRVLATDLPIVMAGQDTDQSRGPGLGDLLQTLESLEPEGGRLLLARGSALSRLALARRRGFEPELVGVIQSTYLGPGARPTALYEVPTLFVQVLAEEEGASVEGGMSWLRRPHPPLLADPELPDLVADWWSGIR